MKTKPLDPRRDPLPEGFVDAVGADDASIVVEPRYLGRRKVDTAKASAPSRVIDRAAAYGK